VSVVCSSKGTVVFNGNFTNKETEASGDMNVTMQQSSKSDGPKRVNHQATKSFTIDTGASSVPAGNVVFKETWVNHSGSDQVTKAFSAKSCSQPESKKVFVCKYVGTPGVDERLQTGNNPISVSWKQGDRVPGTWFNDKHDRSYVLAWDTGQPEPDVSLCPAPEGPPPVTKVPLPADQKPVDACNPAGVTNNVAWKDSLPADTNQVNWSESSNHKTRSASLKGEHSEWSDGTTAPKVFKLPADSGVMCETPPPADHEITVPTVPVVDECGSGNAHYGDVPSGNYTVVRNQDGSITLTAKDGYVFPDGKRSVTLPKPEETNTAVCPTNPPPTVDVCKDLPGNQPEGTDCTPPVKVVEIVNHSGQNCTKTWTWHTTTTKVDGKVVSVKDSNKVYKAKAANTCVKPTKRGIGANTGLDDVVTPASPSTGNNIGIALAILLMGGLVLEVTRRWTRPVIVDDSGRHRKG
jgi:hypothetical protein